MAVTNFSTQKNTMSSKSSSRVKSETIENAVNALLKWKESKSSSEKPQLLPQDEFFYLILTLKKIPSNGGRTNPYKIPLSHPLLQDSLSSEICLVIDDRPKSNLTSEAAKKKVKSENIPVSKVLKLSKLKTNYKPYEARRKLCDSYDMFFADKRVIPLLPKLLGNSFFKKNKLPLPIDLTHKNWKEQIERGYSSALLYMKSGTCCVVKVGKVSMEKGEIVENVGDAVNGIVEFVPKMWEGVRSLHLKLLDSVPLPLYQAVPDMKLKIQGIKEVFENVEEENESEGEVKENKKKDGKLGKKKKGRIHEVRYMDATNVSEGELGSDFDGDENKSEKINDDDDELVGKKRKKGGLAKEQDLSELGAKKLGKKNKKMGKGGRVDTKDENESEEMEKDDPASEEVEIKKKKKKGDAKKGQVVDMNVEKDDLANEEVEIKEKKKKGIDKKEGVIENKNVEKLAKKMSKKGDDEKRKKIELTVKSTEESGTKKGKKNGPGTTGKNSGNKFKNGKKNLSAE